MSTNERSSSARAVWALLALAAVAGLLAMAWGADDEEVAALEDAPAEVGSGPATRSTTAEGEHRAVDRHPRDAGVGATVTASEPENAVPTPPEPVGEHEEHEHEDLDPGDPFAAPADPPPETPLDLQERPDREAMASETVTQRTQHAASILRRSTEHLEEARRAALEAGDEDRARILALRIERQRARAETLEREAVSPQEEAQERPAPGDSPR